MKQLGSAVALARMSAGTAFAVAPARAGSVLVGSDAEMPGARLFVAAFGVRDVLLGAGALRAVLNKQPSRPWFTACAIADAADAGLVLLSYRHLPPGRRLVSLAVSAGPAVLNAWLASAQER